MTSATPINGECTTHNQEWTIRIISDDDTEFGKATITYSEGKFIPTSINKGLTFEIPANTFKLSAKE